MNLVYWYVPALLAPTIMAVALRYRLGRVRWSTQVAVHLAGVLVYSLVHISVLLATRWVLFQEDRPATYPTFWNYARLTYLMQLDFMLMTYLSLVGLAHALAYRRELGVAGARRGASRDAAGRGAAAGAAAAAPSAFSLQHAEYDLGLDAHRTSTPPIR